MGNKAAKGEGGLTPEEVATLSPLARAVYEGNLPVIKKLAKKATVNVQDEEGRTPLYIAALRGNTAAAIMLMKRGADLDLGKDSEGSTALIKAVTSSFIDTTTLLVNNGADIEKADSQGRRPLHFAAFNGDQECGALLLSKEPDLDAQDSEGRTPVHWASYNGHSAFVAFLLENGAELDTIDNSGRTALMYAAFSGKDETVKVLLEQGADIEIKDKEGKTAYNYAVNGGYAYDISFLTLATHDQYSDTHCNADCAGDLIASDPSVDYDVIVVLAIAKALAPKDLVETKEVPKKKKRKEKITREKSMKMEPVFDLEDNEDDDEDEKEIVLTDKQKKKVKDKNTKKKKIDKDLLLQAKEEEVEELKEKVKELQSENETLTHTLATNKTELEDAIREKKDIRNALEKEKKDRAKKEREFAEKLKNASENEDNQHEVKNLKEAIQEKEQELEESNEKRKKEVDKLRKEMEQLSDDLRAYKKSSDQQKQRAEDLEEENTLMRSQVDRLKVELKELRLQDDDTAVFKTKLADKDAKLQERQLKLDKLEGKISQYEQELAEERRRADEAVALYQQAQDRSLSLTEQVTSLNQRLKDQQSHSLESVNRHEKVLQDKDKEIHSANEQLFQAQLKLAELKQETDSLQRSVKQMESQLEMQAAEHSKVIQDSVSALEIARNSNKTLTATLASLQEEISQLRTEKAQATKEIDRLTAQNNELADASQKLETQRAVVSATQQELDTLKAALEADKATVLQTKQELDSELQKAKKELEDERTKLHAGFEAERKALDSERHLLEELKKAVHDKENAFAEERDRVERTKLEVQSEKHKLQTDRNSLFGENEAMEKARQELETQKYAVENRRLDILLEKSGEQEINTFLELEEQNRQLKAKVAILQSKLSEMHFKDTSFSPSKRYSSEMIGSDEKLRRRVVELEAELEQVKKDSMDAFKVHRSHQTMIVQLESKKKELQKRIQQLETERDSAKEQFTRSIREKTDILETMSIRSPQSNRIESLMDVDKSLQRELSQQKQTNMMLTKQLEETMIKLDSLRNLEHLDKEDEKRLIAEFQERIIELESDIGEYKVFADNSNRQIEDLKNQIRSLMAKEEELAVKYQQRLESTEEYRSRLSSQLECELSEEQELRNIISSLEKDLELQRSTNHNLQQFLMQKDHQIQELELKEQVHQTQKRLSDHWRVTIAQEREKLVADRSRYEKERTALLAQLEQERESGRESETQLQAQISILKHDIETNSQSSQNTLHELWLLSESLVVKINELTDLYNNLILNRNTGTTVGSPTTTRQQRPKNFSEMPISQVAQKLRGQTAVLAELSYSAFRVLQTTQQEMLSKKDQFDSVLGSLEKEIQVAKQSYSDLLNLYEQEKQSNAMNVDKIQASEEENTSLRREIDQLLPRITETPSKPKSKAIISEVAESIDTSDMDIHSPGQTRKLNSSGKLTSSPAVARQASASPKAQRTNPVATNSPTSGRKKTHAEVTSSPVTVNPKDFTDLHSAAHKGDITAKAVLEILTDPNAKGSPKHKKLTARDTNGRTALFYAAEQGHAKFASILLDSGAEVNVADNKGLYPIHLAAMQGHLEVLYVLIDKGTNVNIRDAEERTPLFWSVYNNRPKCVQALLEAGAEADSTDNDGRTPLYWAASKGYVDCLKLLLQKGALVNIFTRSGGRPLHKAVYNNQIECVELLLHSGANMEARDKNGATALHTAARSGSVECLRLLLQKGAVVDAVNINGATPLHKAAYNGNTRACELLLDHGAQVGAQDILGATSIHKAAFNGHTECAAFLIERGAEPDCKDANGATPLHMAAYNAHVETSNMLIEKMKQNLNDQHVASDEEPQQEAEEQEDVTL